MTGKLLKDKRVVFALSLALSFILWLIVSIVLRPTGEIVVPGVGVNVNVQSGILGELGLSAIEGAEKTVNVTISGSRSVIGGVSAEDISITPSLSGVTGAGVYELSLKAVNNSTKEFEIVNISPASITVKFDKYIDKVIKLSHVINGEYNVPDEFIQEETYTDPREILVTGPEIDLSYITGAKVEVELSGDIDETTAVLGDVVLLDKDGNPVEYNKNEVTLSAETATVYVPVHKVSQLPVVFEYINVPEGFDISTLKYTLSNDHIVVEGEDNLLTKYTDAFIGYVDMGEINLENTSVTLGISLPEGLKVRDNIDRISVDFDREDYVETTFNATQINIINVPKEYKVVSNANRVAVKVIGPKDVVNSISAKDIVVQLDLSTREINQTGQYRIKADVFIPGVENAWVTGEYSVTVTVKKQ